MDAFAPRYSIGPVRNLGIRSKKTHLNLRSAYERKKDLSIVNSVSIGYFLLLFVSNEYIQFVHPVSFYAFILTKEERSGGIVD